MSLEVARSRNVNKLLSQQRFWSIFVSPYHRYFPLLFSKMEAKIYIIEITDFFTVMWPCSFKGNALLQVWLL